VAPYPRLPRVTKVWLCVEERSTLKYTPSSPHEQKAKLKNVFCSFSFIHKKKGKKRWMCDTHVSLNSKREWHDGARRARLSNSCTDSSFPFFSTEKDGCLRKKKRLAVAVAEWCVWCEFLLWVWFSKFGVKCTLRVES